MAEFAAERPFCTIIGGPNGSGKSTIHPELAPVGEFVNADMEARSIDPVHPERVSLSAGRTVLRRLKALIDRGGSFAYETTLSSRQAISVMAQCRAANYEIALVYVMLGSVELNLLRVAERTARGGHGIPEHVVRRRYEAGFRRLPAAIALADTTLVFDNSERSPQLLLSIENGHVRANELDSERNSHRRLAHSVSEGLRLIERQQAN